MNIPEITPQRFFTGGIITFSIIASMDLINFFVFYGLSNLFGKISVLARVCFEILIVGFFVYNLKMLPTIALNETELKEVDAALAEM